ncbi:MAG: [protein-PII] uridylyltransferase [Flavobacteriales bacterium]|nr:MAG: [protein-PII] uridylyltransferase [Flavobacteriales bacterium]
MSLKKEAAFAALVPDLPCFFRDGQQPIVERFLAGGDALALLHARCRLVDELLGEIWQALALPPSLALLAVGGYGRGELYPASDVDLLILLPEPPGRTLSAQIERLVCLLWDVGLEAGHSVRTLEDCLTQAAGDITVQTAMMETRRIAGSNELFVALRRLLKDTVDGRAFFEIKRMEQEDRHQRFADTPGSLEANCKEGPGGLRDLQAILWMTQAAGYGSTWADLESLGLISGDERQLLERCEAFLRRLRVSLHLHAGRREDRLLFEYQTALAEKLGYRASDTSRSSEQLMQDYYRTAREVSQVNRIVLQNLRSALFPLPDEQPQSINARFQKVHEGLDVVHDQVFVDAPDAIFEAFLLRQQHLDLDQMSPRTQRALWRARDLIDDDFRRRPLNRARFLAILKEGRGLVQELRRMNDFGLLGRYLPAFNRIVGQLQHDLFHVYTVDQHILQVIRNLRRLAMPEFAHEYPLCSRLMSDFGEPWLLYLAALFHDIAKGRGGDHSELGADDADAFCTDHGLTDADRELVTWLVRQHLLMSRVAQRQDISDPAVIGRFAAVVGDERRLVALYLLTVADIRGTSPKVWNGWKAQLLEQLFAATRRLLQSGDGVAMPAGAIAQRQEEARRLMRYLVLPERSHESLWRLLDTAYFLRHSAEEIAWHARTTYGHLESEQPLVRARLNPSGEGLEVLVYTRDQTDLFLRLVGFLSRAGYSIVDARIHTTHHGYALDSFILLDIGGRDDDRAMIHYIEHELSERLARQAPAEVPANGRVSRQVRHFPLQPQVHIQPLVSLEADESGKYFVLTVVAADRPGLLFLVARQLAAHHANLHTAKIATLGERVEDTFLVSGRSLEESSGRVRLETDLLQQLRP